MAAFQLSKDVHHLPAPISTLWRDLITAGLQDLSTRSRWGGEKNTTDLSVVSRSTNAESHSEAGIEDHPPNSQRAEHERRTRAVDRADAKQSQPSAEDCRSPHPSKESAESSAAHRQCPQATRQEGRSRQVAPRERSAEQTSGSRSVQRRSAHRTYSRHSECRGHHEDGGAEAGRTGIAWRQTCKGYEETSSPSCQDAVHLTQKSRSNS